MLIFGRRSDFWDRRGKASHTFALISLLALSLGRNTSGPDVLHSLILYTLKKNNLLNVLLQYQISIKLVHPKLCFQSVHKPFCNDFFFLCFSLLVTVVQYLPFLSRNRTKWLRKKSVCSNKLRPFCTRILWKNGEWKERA